MITRGKNRILVRFLTKKNQNQRQKDAPSEERGSHKPFIEDL